MRKTKAIALTFKDYKLMFFSFFSASKKIIRTGLQSVFTSAASIFANLLEQKKLFK